MSTPAVKTERDPAGSRETGHGLSEERFAAYVEAWKRRARVRDAEEDQRREEALKEAARAARILAERFGVTKVVLFGSLVWKRRFGPDSDIDLAVSGLAAESFFRADATLAMEIPFPIDMKVLAACTPSLRERIERKGIVLHER